MLRPLTSASSCSTARVSMSWKFSVRRSPVYSLSGLNRVAFFSAAVFDDRLDLDRENLVGLVRQLARKRRARMMTMRTLLAGAHHVHGVHRASRNR